ncbi:hypothetical protein SLE2022_403610 [Rubroshorea leprosula]
MGLTLYLGIKRGKIACHKSEARFGTLLREGRLASRASRDEAFWRSQVNFGPPNPATDEKALWSKGKCVRCHTPCLPKVPRGRARRSRARQPGSGFPTGRGTGYGHLEAHHDLQATPARPGKATRLGGSLFCNGKKRSRFDSAQPNNTSNTNDLCLECVARSLL